MTPRARLGSCLAIVALLGAAHVHLKTAKIFANPTWDARDEVGQFWSEFAFHYRFAKFFAAHPLRDWGQLARDRAVQFPDTINDWEEFTVAMEVPVGVLYRWMYGAPLTLTLSPQAGRGDKPAFHVFVVWYDCVMSSLTLFAVFFLARALWRSDAAGVLASALYATLYPSYGRTVKNLFLREDFAIPLIVFALFFTVRALRPVGRVTDAAPREVTRPTTQILAALFWLAALASWHLTQFVMAPLILAAVLVYLGKGETPRLPWLVLTMAVGTVAIPVLRAKQVYLSPSMCALYALSLAVWINGGRKKAALVFACWLAAFLCLGALLQKSYGEYAHVYQLFFYKLRFLGVKPDDPSQLPWEARVLWEGAFNTASMDLASVGNALLSNVRCLPQALNNIEFWHSLAWCGPLALVGVWMAWREKDVALHVVVLFTVLLFPLAWMVVRYFTFLGFAAAVMTAGLITRRIWWRAAVVVAVVWQFFLLDLEPMERGSPEPKSCAEVVGWLNENTPTNAVLLAQIADSPVLLAHTGRPIIMHSKFENRRIRERYREMLEAIYGSETQFHEFATKYGADYFVYDTGFLLEAKDSRRYKADKMGMLDPNSAAMLFQYRPQALRHFEPEFVGGRFAVFRVLR